MLLLGHRGARNYARENSFAAFDTALEHGCDGFEFDVRRTSDERGVVVHDAEIQRVPVAENSYLNLCSLKSGVMPCVEDVVRRYAARAFLDIELKVPALDDAVADALRESPPEKGYVVSSFLPEVLESLRRTDARMTLGYICDDRKRLAKWRELPVDCVIPQYGLVDAELVQELHGAGKQVFVWTVNRAPEMLRMRELGVDAVISDDTQLLCRTLRAR